jgi:hypothetical protein
VGRSPLRDQISMRSAFATAWKMSCYFGPSTCFPNTDNEMIDKHFRSLPHPLPPLVEIFARIRVIPAQPRPPDTAGIGGDQAVRVIGHPHVTGVGRRERGRFGRDC